MSFEYYANWWIVAKEHLENLYVRDQIFRKKAAPLKDRYAALDIIGDLYVRYSRLVQELDVCVDQMAHPQVRQSAKKLLDAACIRLNEINEALREIDISEFHYVDGNLIELKFVPYDVEYLHPSLFVTRPVDITDMIKKINKGERIFEIPGTEELGEEEEEEEEEENEEEHEVGEEEEEIKVDKKKSKTQAVKIKEEQNPKDEKKTKKKPPGFQEKELSPQELEELKQKATITACVLLIQTAERGRQERTYFYIKNLLCVRKQYLQSLPAGKQPTQPSPEIEEDAAITIQSMWRGYMSRQLMKNKEIQRRFIIGMYEPRWKSKYEFNKFKENLQKRRDYRDQRIKEYVEDIAREKTRILRVVAPGLLEDIQDEIREWFRIWYVGAQCFDKYPPEKKGGTILVVRGETMTPKEYLEANESKKRKKKTGGKDMEKEKAKKEKQKQKEAKKKAKEQEKKLKAAKRKKKLQMQKRGEYEYDYDEETRMVVPYETGQAEYTNEWNKRNYFEDPLEKHYMDIITDQECYETQLEIRRIADEFMVIELELLNEALQKDKAKAKGKKYKPKKKKKKKKGKKKGKKKKKDPTGDRLVEDIFQELVDNGIIRTYPEVHLDEYKGDFSYNGYDLRKQNLDPPATLLDVRQAIVMNCILPLGVTEMKRPRSVLICGPKQMGKHLLANAVFNETQCVLFDLSPEVTAGKYPGKPGLKMLIHLINKMSRLLQPSILYFAAAEKIFYKKVPKEEKELDPKRLGKKLMKGIIKTIKPPDRVLVLGVTNQPWAASGAKLKKAFERAILIPRPDYASVYQYWREILMSYHGVDNNFNVTAIAKLTVNYPFPVLKQVLQSVLVPRRIIQLQYKPLMLQELYEVIVSQDIQPITDKMYKKYLKWYKKTPLGKQRFKFNKIADKLREMEKRASAGKK